MRVPCGIRRWWLLSRLARYRRVIRFRDRRRWLRRRATGKGPGVQTFLHYPGFTASARALDGKRLGKQRVETIQVLRGLTRAGYGWRHHPAVKMWRGYEEALVRYGLDMCAAWSGTGRADT